MFVIQLHGEQGFVFVTARRWTIHDRFEKLPILFKFRYPIPIKPEAFTIGAKAMVLQFFVQIFQNFFAIINRLINRVAQVTHKGIVKTFTQRFNFFMALRKDVVFIAII